MGRIIKYFSVWGDKAKAELPVLLDSGASASVIREDVAGKICKNFTKLVEKHSFNGVNGKSQLTANSTCILQIKMKDYILDGKFYVVKGLKREILIGADFMQVWDIELKPKKHDYTIGVNPNELEII